MRPLRVLTAVAAAAATMAALPAPSGAAHHPKRPTVASPRRVHSDPSTPRAYARELAARRGWTGYQWVAIVEIIEGPVRADGHRSGGESGWDACAVYPSRHDCGYEGSNSCGIPQANPCPREWRGRLAATWRAQIRWFLNYIVSHGYGTPAVALAHHHRYGSY